jgi:hypothetical protein
MMPSSRVCVKDLGRQRAAQLEENNKALMNHLWLDPAVL